MKSLTAVCQTGASMPAINPNGRITRHPPHRGDGENAEMKMYLSKLKDLVPFMPKNRKLSKLEIIQHVIDYICDLQSELETHPEMSNFDAASALNFSANLERISSAHNEEEGEGENEQDDEMTDEVQERLNSNSTATHHQLQQQQQQQQQSSPAQRQPLVDLQTPNTILPATQQQQQAIVSAANNTSTFNFLTTSSTANNSSSTTAADNTTTSTTLTAAATNLSHTLNPEKHFESRQTSSC